ncbi:NUDIX domain-containing protein [Schaalia vaccimaxillae]|uniref:NUDIX domain-containing protein n=1 Tax=Schaalia vaccimaxillae TaxID=183916 RepID=UPI0003F81FD0|nr:NUDIX domain-containing protein [Schaalia vaccimaxillae]
MTHPDPPSSPSATTPTPRPVAAAAIVDSLSHPTRLLCAARAYPQDLRGRFELPGGKIEHGEQPTDALVREIREELDCQVTVGPQVHGPEDGWWPILQGRRMGVWLCEVPSHSPAPTCKESHLELRWMNLAEIVDLDWIGHDLLIALAVANQCARIRHLG